MLSNRRTLIVEWGDCDPNGIVFNPRYFAWFDTAVHALLGRVGLSLRQLIAEHGIDGLPLGDTRAKFHLPLRYDDEIIIETAVTQLHRCAFELHHRVLKDGIVAVEGFETRVMTALDAATGRVRARALPAEVVKCFSGNAAAPSGAKTVGQPG